MKKYKAISIILLLVILSGCSKFETDDTEKSQETKSIAENGIGKAEVPKGCEIVYDMEKFQTVTKDQSYNSKTDVNTSSVRYSIADTGDFVYLGMDHWLGCLDRKTGKGSLVCGKPDCEHNNTSICNAMFTFSMTGLQYYDGALYTVNAEQYCLVRISTDGTEREKVLDLRSSKGSIGTMYIEWFIHREYIYYAYRLSAGSDEDTYYLNNSNCIYRKALDGKSEAECIMALPVNSLLEKLNWYGLGSYIYIATPCDVENGGQLYRYNTESGQLEWFKNFGNNIISCAARDNNIYYIQNNEEENVSKMYAYNIEAKEKKELFELNNKCNRMYYDSDYIYLLYGTDELGNSYLGIWNWNGEHQADMKQEMNYTDTGAEILVYSESDNDKIYLYASIFADSEDNNPYGTLSHEYRYVKYIEKEDIADGEYEIKEWKEIVNTQ